MTLENDVVLIYFEDAPVVFGRVEHITADHKKDWFQVTILMLAVPLQTVTWILREEYINGAEFTMEGQKVKLEKVVAPVSASVEHLPQDGDKAPTSLPKKSSGDTAEVISFPSPVS